MSKMDDVKRRIKGLLAMSRDKANENESYLAFTKAQELMAKYKLSVSDVEDKPQESCIKRKTQIKYGTRSSDHYINDLATIIAQNFCCINYISTPKGTQSHYVCFMGAKDDVDIAEEILHTANTAIIRGYDQLYKDVCKEFNMDYLSAKLFNPIKTGYVDGYLDGLKVALESQKEQNQEWGLVLVAPKEAQDFLENLNKSNFGAGGNSLIDRSYYGRGYEEGKDFQRSKKLTDQKLISN